jgi:hypothetical protein
MPQETLTRPITARRGSSHRRVVRRHLSEADQEALRRLAESGWIRLSPREDGVTAARLTGKARMLLYRLRAAKRLTSGLEETAEDTWKSFVRHLLSSNR